MKRAPLDQHWLRPAAAAQVARDRRRWHLSCPLPADQALLDWWWCSRARTVATARTTLLAADTGTTTIHPFHDPRVIMAVAATFGRWGLDRTAAMRQLFGDLLPDTLLARRTKAWFDEAFFTDHARTFADSWSGTGVDTTLVDPEALQREWRTPLPDGRSLLLLQQAWLAARTAA